MALRSGCRTKLTGKFYKIFLIDNLCLLCRIITFLIISYLNSIDFVWFQLGMEFFSLIFLQS